MNRKTIDYLISRVPIVTFICIVGLDIIISNMNLSEEDYWVVYFREIELLKSGLFINIAWLLMAFRYKLCWYNKVSILGMMSMNIVTLIFEYANGSEETYELYNTIFTHTILIPTAILAIILLIKKI